MAKNFTLEAKFCTRIEYVCQNCSKTWQDPGEVPSCEDWFARVEPGDMVPHGECDSCGALVLETGIE